MFNDKSILMTDYNFSDLKIKSLDDLKHVLLYTDDPSIYGVGQYNHIILCELARLGYKVTCVQSHASNQLIKQRQQLGIEHLWLDYNTLQEFSRTLTSVSDAQNILANVKPDLVIFSDCCPLSNLAAKKVANQRGIPYIIVEGFVAPYLAERFVSYLEELEQIYAQARAVIAVSTENLNLLHQLFRLPKDKGQVIYYGRPEHYFAPPTPSVRDRLRQDLEIPANAVVCFTTARLEPVKGFQYQLEAIQQLKQSAIWSQLYFIWAGTGTLETQLKAELEQLGVTKQVKLIGERSDINNWLDTADIFILPSQLEGMPLSIMEAMAKGLPVIATAVSGIPEELGETGKLLTDPKIDPQATVRELVTTIQLWTLNPESRYNQGQIGKKRAEAMFKEERMVKETVRVMEDALLPVEDYISPNFSIIRPDRCFPNMIVGDTSACGWSYLRREIPHNWYVDKRQPTVDFLSRDEAHILYNTALKFRGKKALEIGCWLGWSACHLALAGVELDVIDPLLDNAEIYESVSNSLKNAGVLDSVNLVAGYSPQKVEELAKQLQRKWSLIFIDGDHDTPGPLNDAIICEQLAEADALILFHDLSSPDVAQGLDYLKQRGWNTMVYQTMQIMAVAWRGSVEPVQHQPDPSIIWILPVHLKDYKVSGLENNHKQQIDLTSKPDVNIDLTYIANKYGSDKGNLVGCKHGYAEYYEFLFSGLREKKFKLLELGLLIGGPELYDGAENRNTDYPPSVGMWKEYFSNIHIYGFDISDFSKFEDDRFTFIQGDLGKESDYQRILNTSKSFDIIVDDASHASYHQQVAFIHLFDSVNPGGYYIIEDLQWQPESYEESLPKVPLTYHFFHHYIENGFFLPSQLFDNSNLERLSGLVQNMYFLYQTLHDPQGFPVGKIPKLCVIQKKNSTTASQAVQSPSVISQINAEQVGHQSDRRTNSIVSSYIGNYQSTKSSSNSSKLRVTFCTYDAPNFTGGPNAWLRRLLPALKQAGVEVSVLFFVTTTSPEACPCFRELSNQGIDCQAFSWQTITEQKIHWLLSKLAENPPDVFVPNMLVAAFYASRWVQEVGIPTVGILHSDDEFHQGVLRTFVWGKEAYRLSALVCVSQFLDQYAQNKIEADDDSCRNWQTQIKRIPCGVPLSHQIAQPPSDCLKLIYVGRLEEEQKQISEVTRALCRAVSRVPNVEAVIVGEGAARANVERILSDDGKNLPIRLMGLIDNSQVQKVMSEHHVLVLLSDYEGLPIALMEAMACGLVPICLRMRSGVPELVEDEVTGLLVGDREDEFTNAVQRLRNQPELWKQLSLAARAKIETNYSSDLCTAKWLSLLQELISETGIKPNIRNPKQINLPPVYPAFIREDYREFKQLSSSPKSDIKLNALRPHTNSVINLENQNHQVFTQSQSILQQVNVSDTINTDGYSIQNVKYIYDIVAKYHQLHSEPSITNELRNLRKQTAEFWLSVEEENQLEELYTSKIGERYQAIVKSGIQNQDLTESEHQFVNELIAQVAKGFDEPKAIQYLLVAMLYRRADQLPLQHDLTYIPQWLLNDYLKYIFEFPRLFQEKGEADNYYRYLQQWLDYLQENISNNQESALWQYIAKFFLQAANFIPLYFTTENLKGIYTKRADIMEYALKIQGCQIDYDFPERSPERKKIRLGVLAAHLQPSTETFHTLPAYKHLDWNSFEIILYTVTANNSRLERYCAGHVDALVTLPPDLQSQVQMIRDGDIDVLLIATNVTAVTNQIILLALHRLARIQLTFGSCPVTTGIRNIDYFISGSLSEPVSGGQEHYREKLVTLDGVGYCFDYPSGLEATTIKPNRESWGATEKTVVFTSGANFYKIIPELREAWAKILAAVPDSILVLYPFAPSWSDSYPANSFLNQMYAVLARYDVEKSRLIVLDALPSRADVKEVLKLADVYLDSYRHSGGHSLVDALEVGLTTVVLEGDALRSRHAAAYLREIQIPDLITNNEMDYIKLAIALGTDPELRQQKSAQIKEKMQGNPSFLDSRSYSAKIGSLFQELFSKYLVDTLSQNFRLGDINLIIFPDWSQPEDLLYQDLASVISTLTTHPDKSRLTLLIDTHNVSEEEADILLSSLTMNLLMEGDVDITEGPEISLLGKISDAQWKTLLPRINTRIALATDNQSAIAQAKAETLSSCDVDSLIASKEAFYKQVHP